MNWCKKNGLLALVLSSMLVLALVVAGCGGGSKPAEPAKKDAPPVKWVANSVWPPNNHQSVGLVRFAKRVKDSTKGKVEMTLVQVGGALGYKGPELLKVVRDGLVPVSDMLTSGVAGDELFNVVTLPFLIQSF